MLLTGRRLGTWLLLLGAAAFASAADLAADPAAREAVVRQAVASEEVLYTDSVAVGEGAGARVLAYLQAAGWHGFLRLAPAGSGWAVESELRFPLQKDAPAWLQVSSGWTLTDAEGDGSLEAVYFGCMPHNCCGEFGLAVFEAADPGGWVVHLQGGAASALGLRLESRTAPPRPLRPYFLRQMYDNLCDKTEAAKATLETWLEALP